MATYVIVRHRAADFSKWKPGYDEHKPSRDAAGLTEKHLFQDVDDPNSVTLIFEVADLAKAQAFSTSDDLREAMQRVGVVGKPDIYFVKGQD